MYYINLSEGGHSWTKMNLVTMMSKKGSYDIYKCQHCGIIGKTINLTLISLKGSYSRDKVYNCPNNHKATVIRITNCFAHGLIFSNLTPGSEHKVISPPNVYSDDTGTWVMGVGEPVKIFPNEFEIIN